MFLRNRTPIRNQALENALFARRAIIAFVGVIILMFVLLSNLYNIQVNSYDKYQTQANGNRIKVIPIAPNRGLIYDRNGTILAENKPSHSLEIIPEKTKNLTETIDALAKLVTITDEERERFLKSVKRQRRFKSIVLKSRLTPKQVAQLSVNLHQIPAARIEARLKRHYPFAHILTHALGYVAKLNKKDQARIIAAGEEATYAATRDIGRLGIEKFYQKLLHGQPGYREIEVNNRGRVVRILNEVAPEHGQDLYLNLDINLQKKAYQELAGRRGSVVAIDPNNGAVLAMVSSPSYDPNLFVHGISGKNYRALLSADKPLINRATQGTYPPASTIKQLMSIVALEEKIITEKTSIRDPGWFRLPNVERPFRDHLAWGHGKVDVYKAMLKSCDTFFYDVANRLGIDRISTFMDRFGFGQKSGVDIYEEKQAIMPSRAWKRARHNQPWYPGDTISLGIGQSYWTATPIQLANSTAIVAASGQFFTPQLLGASQGANGLLQLPADERPPVILRDNYNWKIAQKGMWGVVNKLGGTAYNVFKGANYVSAGKTGTAQLISIAEDEEYDEEKISERHRDNAMYVGYAPFDKPEIALTVVVENAGGGGSSAAPIARKLFDVYLDQRSISPSLVVNQQSTADHNVVGHTH
ncbi:MAG: penicillin-binding protein 2 [Gammaproteobacteria bacterium MedPE]|nr:MAG: penicillin-binding protein 2 [Gammaproteobacteria bacterium MedPE]